MKINWNTVATSAIATVAGLLLWEKVIKPTFTVGSTGESEG